MWTDFFLKKDLQSIEKSIAFLKLSFKISFLSYRKLDTNGNLLLLSPHTEWQKVSLSNRYYISKPLFKKIIKHNDSIFQTHFWSNQIYEPLCQALYDLNLWYGISIFKKQSTHVDIFSFCTSREQPDVVNTYLNYSNILQHFIFYLIEKLNSTTNNYLPQAKISLEHFNENDANNASLSQSNINAFLTATPIEKYSFNLNGLNITLSCNQKKVLHYLSQGKSYKEIASLMSISPRTVEAHIQNLKNKFRCYTKSEIVNKGVLNYFGD